MKLFCSDITTVTIDYDYERPVKRHKLKIGPYSADQYTVTNTQKAVGGDDVSNLDGKTLEEKLGNARQDFEDAPIHIYLLIYVSIIILFILGALRDFLRKIGIEKNYSAQESPRQKDFVALYSGFDSTYYRNCYVRIRDAWNVPICSVPAAETTLLDTTSDDYNWTFRFTGTKTKVINLASYNYLGFAETNGYCIDNVLDTIEQRGLGSAVSRSDIGVSTLHTELEKLTALFIGVEAAICTPMGFSTNSMNIPCLMGQGSLILSDRLNHTSLVLGCKLSGATVWIFNHNDPSDLEQKLIKALKCKVDGRKQFHKIMIVVEGIYSMEGSICRLYEIVKLKKKYKAYLYVDEAHSIGALGCRGRGVCEYWGIDPRHIDILMGTFTKSFGAAGGYIAGSKQLIDYVKTHGHSSVYGSTFSAPVAQQVISSMKVIMGLDATNSGQQRFIQLARNVHYFRERLKQMGFIVYGNKDSPVVPVMIYNFGIVYMARECRRLGLGVVVAGAPATHITGARARFCISAAHTKQQLDKALSILDEIGDQAGMKHSRLKYRPGEHIRYKN